MRSWAAFALILAVAACDKGDKKDDNKDEGQAKAEEGSGSASGSGSGSASASGSGAVTAGLGAGTAADTQGVVPPSGGGNACDQLIAATRCMFDKSGGAVPDSAKKSFEDGVAAWEAALANDTTRQATLDACQMSLDGGKTGFDAVGCGGGGGGGTTTGMGVGSGVGSGSGSGGTAAVVPADSIGAAECDELVARSRCSFGQMGAHMPADALKAFEDGIKSWKDALAMGGQMRSSTVDACRMALEAGKAGFEASGCGGPEHGSLLGAAGGGSATTKTAGGPMPEIESVGEPTCDKMIERTMCAYKQAGDAMPVEAIQAFADGVKSWKEMLANQSMRQAIIDACKQSLEAADSGFKAVGC